MPANRWSPMPRYADVNTSMSCPAARNRLSSSTSHGAMTSSALRGKAVTTCSTRIAGDTIRDPCPGSKRPPFLRLGGWVSWSPDWFGPLRGTTLMAQRIAPASPELAKFYSARHDWRNSGEERMRFRKATALARVKPGSAVLDIGSRNGDLRRYLPPDVKYQGLDIAPEFAAADILVHDISQGLPFADASFDYVFMIEVLEHTPTAYATAGEIHRVLRPGRTWVVSVPHPHHPKEIIRNLP